MMKKQDFVFTVPVFIFNEYQASHNQGQPDETYCPFSKSRDGCNLLDIHCRYGLTNISVPKECPLRHGDVKVGLRMENNDGRRSN